MECRPVEAVARKSPRAAFPPRSHLWGQKQKGPSWNRPLGPRFPFLRKEVDGAWLIGKPAAAQGWCQRVGARPLWPAPPPPGLSPGPGAHKASHGREGSRLQGEARKARSAPGEQWRRAGARGVSSLLSAPPPGLTRARASSPHSTDGQTPALVKGGSFSDGCPLLQRLPVTLRRPGAPGRAPEQRAKCVIFRRKAQEHRCPSADNLHLKSEPAPGRHVRKLHRRRRAHRRGAQFCIHELPASQHRRILTRSQAGTHRLPSPSARATQAPECLEEILSGFHPT